MKNRDIDLVINSEEDMRCFLIFLIIKLNTHNGAINSIQKLKDRRIISKHATAEEMTQKILYTFTLMKIRMKISFEACRTNRTIQEIILYAILKTYHERNAKGLISDPYPKISNRMIESVKGTSIKALTEKNILMEEAKASEMKKMGYQARKDANANLGRFVGKILRTGGVADLFEELYESGGEGQKD